MFPSRVNLQIDIVLRIVGRSSLAKCESNVKVSKQQRQSALARPGPAGCIGLLERICKALLGLETEWT